MELLPTPHLRQLISMALEEDAGRGDVTSEAIFPPSHTSEAVIVAKESGIICGLPLIAWIFETLGEDVSLRFHAEEGASIQEGEEILHMTGRTVALLVAERTILNFLQHLSGIATVSNTLARKHGSSLRIMDTRKTLPGWRRLQKYAVATGGLHNHRYDLGSGVLIKDNHITAAGSITAAVEAVRKYAPHSLVIEVEVSTLEELDEAAQAGAGAVLLDNMDDEQIVEAVRRYKGRVFLEASGAVTEDRLEALAATGVDGVSMGLLTHTVKPLDLSMYLTRVISV